MPLAEPQRGKAKSLRRGCEGVRMRGESDLISNVNNYVSESDIQIQVIELFFNSIS